MLNILIRTDASIALGTGHVMRCLTLADCLRAAGGEIAFSCRRLPGNLCDLIEMKGYKVHHMANPEDGLASIDWQEDAAQTKAALADSAQADWLIVDHYGLDRSWESAMRPFVRRIMVIDDLADRPHDCDVLLDQNFYKKLEHRYEGLVPEYCLRLLGPTYALLRPEFFEARRHLRQRDGLVRRILVFLGGGDSQNVTSKVIEAIVLTGHPEIALDVVIGSTNPHHEQIAELCSPRRNARLHIQVENMAALMASADLSIGAGGATTWERCFLGLPTLTVVFADNQEQTTIDLADTGAIRYIGWADNVGISELAEAIDDAISHPEENVEMGHRAMQVMRDFVHDSQPQAAAALLQRTDSQALRGWDLPVTE